MQPRRLKLTPHAPLSTPHAPLRPLPAARSALPAARSALPAARSALPAARSALPAARCPLPAARSTLHSRPIARCGARLGWWLAVVGLQWFLSGCLSKSYQIRRADLLELSSRPEQERWQSVRALQNLGGHDEPPADPDVDVAAPPAPGVPAVIIVSHHHHPHFGPHAAPTRPPPPLPPRPGSVAPRPSGPGTAGRVPALSTSDGHAPVTSSGGSSKKGNGDPAAAALVAAAVVVGAGLVIGAAASEGARYDGWLAVHPDEPLYLSLAADGKPDWRRVVPLSALTMQDVANAENATIYEGWSGRFERLGRAPLDRAGFTGSTGFHLGALPQPDRSVSPGLGPYLQFGGNIANLVTLGLAATADFGLHAQSMLHATVGPEILVYPLRYAGIYLGAGWAYRNAQIEGRTRADAGWLVRGGVALDLPLTTRLAWHTQVGMTRYEIGGQTAPVAWEIATGLAVF